MEEHGAEDLLCEAMGSAAQVVVVEDCVEAPGAFVLHLLLKRALAGCGSAAFLALAQPFSHYDRVLRKMVPLAPRPLFTSPAFRQTRFVLTGFMPGCLC
jgi:hypothetical protein|uniref:Elongator complex protein 6 n=1 Tax=Zea mays TaxID=4577 RepID=B8A3C1_MAIZE|nr:unknown [Zea mays]ACR35031.1 unknown [Zea mays]